VGSALGFQYIGGYIPCKLCYEQRIPYYVGIPLMVLAVLASLIKLPAWTTRALLVIVGLLMVYGLYLGVYHSGVEWAWWPGPTDCTNVAGPVDTGGNGVLDALDKFVPPSCDKRQGGAAYPWPVAGRLERHCQPDPGSSRVSRSAVAPLSIPESRDQGSSSTSQ